MATIFEAPVVSVGMQYVDGAGIVVWLAGNAIGDFTR